MGNIDRKLTPVEEKMASYAGIVLDDIREGEIVYNVQEAKGVKGDNEIIFNLWTECITFKGTITLDTSMMYLLQERMKELGWTFYIIVEADPITKSEWHFEREE